MLGRYLSPRLYISYGISLTQSLNTVKLRYTLSDRWTIKTEAGQARGADLVYTIQKVATASQLAGRAPAVDRLCINMHNTCNFMQSRP